MAELTLQEYQFHDMKLTWLRGADKLTDAGAINQVRDTGILTLSETFYDKQMGLNLEGNSKLDFIGGF